MLAVERHRAILNRVKVAGSVRVADLASELDVTEETIRRDLEKLDHEGKLLRIHGGAVPVEEGRRELPFSVRETVNRDAKRMIAARAVRHIHEGDVIALDASSTARELALVIPDVFLTVVTNCLAVTTALLDRHRIRVVSTGGILDVPSRSYVGAMTERALDHFNFTKLFLSCQGVDPARGLSVTADEHAGIKRRMMDLTETTYLLADGVKIGARATEFFARLDEVDVLITDPRADPDVLEAIAGHGVTVETATGERLKVSRD